MVALRNENVVMEKGSYFLWCILFWGWVHALLGTWDAWDVWDVGGVDGDYVHSWFLGVVVGSRLHCCPLQRHHLTKHVLI